MQQIREFRYKGVGIARYWTRDWETDGESAAGQSWTEHNGDSVAKDLDYVAGNPEHDDDPGGFAPRTRYIHGYGAGGGPGLIGIIDDAGGGSGSPPSNWYFLHADLLGSTRLITNSAGDAAGAMGYTAFGIPLGPDGILDGADEPVGGIATRFAWCGAWGYETDDLVNPSSDDDLGMIHIGARWYDPTIGRFLQRDPIGLRGGTNTFVLAFDSPATFVDPEGMLLPFTLFEQATIVPSSIEQRVKMAAAQLKIGLLVVGTFAKVVDFSLKTAANHLPMSKGVRRTTRICGTIFNATGNASIGEALGGFPAAAAGVSSDVGEEIWFGWDDE